jgi:hypothetical protein
MLVNGSMVSATTTHGENVELAATMTEVFDGWDNAVWSIFAGTLGSDILPTLRGIDAEQEPRLVTIANSDPFLINSAGDLLRVGKNIGNDGWTLSAHYKLNASIDLPSEGNWTPIGTIGSPFTGSFDGDGKSISGLTIDNSNADHQGLFGVIGEGGVVRNLDLIDVSITGENFVGGIAGWLNPECTI